MRITRRTFVAAPAEDVWKLACDFSLWHPKLAHYTGGPETSAELVVTVVERDDAAMSLRYTMPEPPFSIVDHTATITVRDNGHSTSYVTWEADLDAAPEQQDELEDKLGDDVFDVALDQLATTAQDAQVPTR
jgi:carbon monoxide dehydrogenase subunit G